MLSFLLFLFLFFISIVASAQTQRLSQYKPPHEERLQRYQTVALKEIILKYTNDEIVIMHTNYTMKMLSGRPIY